MAANQYRNVRILRKKKNGVAVSNYGCGSSFIISIY